MYPIELYILFYFLNCVYIFFINFHCLFRSFLSIYIPLLALDSAVMASSKFASSATAKLSVLEVFLSAPVSSASKSSIIYFLSRKSLIYNLFNFEWSTQWEVQSPLFIFIFEEIEQVFPILIWLLGLTHSNLFQFNWNLQSFQYLIDYHIFYYFILLILWFLRSFGVLSDGSPLGFFSFYHPPPISVVIFGLFVFA